MKHNVMGRVLRLTPGACTNLINGILKIIIHEIKKNKGDKIRHMDSSRKYYTASCDKKHKDI